jgi:cell division protein FtsL
MATLATFFRRADAARRADQAPPIVRVDAESFELRALPAEDVYFYSKRIDNSRVVRQADPQARGDCLATIGAACLLIGLLATAAAPKLGGILSGYQLQALEQERLRLTNEYRVLEVEEAALRSPARLEQLARERNLVQPSPEQIVHLDPRADGSLAFHVKRK